MFICFSHYMLFLFFLVCTCPRQDNLIYQQANTDLEQLSGSRTTREEDLLLVVEYACNVNLPNKKERVCKGNRGKGYHQRYLPG
ncbi:hypothetical protein EJ02DRAFT_450716 [Clathrospora elynae]|uniref:Secreted protein n=1 Tax=Clathrospora elynae TaxID=706981 RepID=A0A6A5TBH6_9PLEO|nr:hypothetical protein EJ02DRAFT_450716 [Clathrospora elynae]